MRKGFTLAEVLLAIFFVSVAIFALVSLQIRLIYGTYKLQVHQTATQTACTALVTAVAGAESKPVGADPGLPAGLSLVQQSTSWTDHNGSHAFAVDTYVRTQMPGW